MKSESGHTPGEWIVDDGGVQRANVGEGIRIRQERSRLTVGVAVGGLTEVNANARLIAAAPELLSALKVLSGTEQPFHLQQMIDAAIAKATVSP